MSARLAARFATLLNNENFGRGFSRLSSGSSLTFTGSNHLCIYLLTHRSRGTGQRVDLAEQAEQVFEVADFWVHKRRLPA